MINKAEILLHPVRMKISQVLMSHQAEGLTPLEMVKKIKDVPQATLYRHIQVLLNAGVIRVIKEKKVRSVSEKYYTLNEKAARLDAADWKHSSMNKKLSYVSYYQLSLMTQYQNYLQSLEKNESEEDRSTFSLLELKIDEEDFNQFQQKLNNLMLEYYQKKSTNSDAPTRTIAVTIIPENQD